VEVATIGSIKPYFQTENFVLYHGDANEILQSFDAESIDLVLTDPPYPREFFCTYIYLAEHCPRLMKDGASLVTIIPHFSLPEVLKQFDGKLKWRWLLHMNQWEGSHARLAMGIECCMKPLGWWVKRAYPKGRGFIRDGVKVTGKDGQKKSRHKWEQDISSFLYFCEKLTKAGDTVLDPYLGSGTTMEVAIRLGRRCVGIELEEEHCKTSVERYHEVSKQIQNDLSNL
jgi:DNA modification methylase